MFLCRIYVFRCMCVSIRRKPFLGIRLSARCQPYAGSYPLWGYERNGSCPVLNAEMRCCKIKAVMAAGFHLFPFRTEKLSPPAPMVLRKWESRRPPTFQGSLRRRVSNSLFSFSFFAIPFCYLFYLFGFRLHQPPNQDLGRTCGKVFGLSLAIRTITPSSCLSASRRRGGRIQRQFLPKRVFTHQRAGRNLIAADMGRFGYEADVCQLSASR